MKSVSPLSSGIAGVHCNQSYTERPPVGQQTSLSFSSAIGIASFSTFGRLASPFRHQVISFIASKPPHNLFKGFLVLLSLFVCVLNISTENELRFLYTNGKIDV